ncbi:MAG TPA: aminoglycoside phosphotransferase family protein [Actinomycetota bacterium]|nr:aminoglycoside phosphotransferase family protein [Actinomycetota bacterium]
MTVPPPPVFADDDAYERSLDDPVFWKPYARAALRLSGLEDEGEVRTHVPTTHVAALVGDQYLVKLHYEDWFGEDCFQTEREAYRMLVDHDLPVPDLLAEGALYDEGWRWPFLVMTAMGGRSLRDVGDSVTPEDYVRAAAWLGEAVRALHGVPIRDGERISHEVYCDLIRVRMQRSHHDHEVWGSLPTLLVPRIRDYLWKARTLIDPEIERPVFLHGDLHAGNVFVRGEPGGLEACGLIDFNDAYEGDPHYDLVAIHAKALRGDKRLLETFLDAYGWGELGRRWPQRMMALTLAHDFDMMQPFAGRIPDEVESLDDLASLLWDLDAPGLPGAAPTSAA